MPEKHSRGRLCHTHLEALLRMKFTAFRHKDRVHILDMLEVGLIDATWIPRLPPDLAERLQTLIDTAPTEH